MSFVGQRKIFNLPNGFCFFQKKIYKTNDIFRPEDCTECKCLVWFFFLLCILHSLLAKIIKNSKFRYHNKCYKFTSVNPMEIYCMGVLLSFLIIFILYNFSNFNSIKQNFVNKITIKYNNMYSKRVIRKIFQYVQYQDLPNQSSL